MYTRPYYQENGAAVPKGYDGNAFRIDDTPTIVTPTYGATKVSPEYMAEESEEVFSASKEESFLSEEENHEGVFSRIISHIPVKKLPFGLGDIFGRVGCIELEDIIIVAVALLLIFSGEGDKLLGIALLALLFV